MQIDSNKKNKQSRKKSAKTVRSLINRMDLDVKMRQNKRIMLYNYQGLSSEEISKAY